SSITLEKFRDMADQAANQTAAISPLQAVSIVIFTISTNASLFAYTLVLVILFAYFKEFKSNFYVFVISLAIADIGFLMVVLFYCVPCAVLKRDIWPSVPSAVGIFESISYFGQCTHLTFIAAYRFIYACVSGTKHPLLEKILNSRPAIVAWL